MPVTACLAVNKCVAQINPQALAALLVNVVHALSGAKQLNAAGGHKPCAVQHVGASTTSTQVTAGFSLAGITDFSFDFGGLTVTLADTQLAGATITAFGTLSADGAAISGLDLRFDLPTTVAFCSLICAGQIQIASFDRSNFVAITTTTPKR